MNPFDIAVCSIAAIAIVTGFRSGLLRSVATILGYVSATPVAIFATSWITPALAGQSNIPLVQNSLIFFAVFLMGGLVISAALRLGVDEAVGPVRSMPDKMLGAALGGVRTVLVALTIVVVVDRIAPPGHDPGFLIGSKIRPMLSLAGQSGLKSLPPEISDYIDKLKKSQHI